MEQTEDEAKTVVLDGPDPLADHATLNELDYRELGGEG